MIVLVTGSRKWVERGTLFDALSRHDPDRVIHGGADGADAMAHEWCKKNGRIAEVHFPDWKRVPKAALRRNDEMVGQRPDVVLAFPMPDSRGTRYTIRVAREAGIPVEVYEGE